MSSSTLKDASGNALGGTDNPLVASPSADQDPIFDHVNGVCKSITASEVLITPPAGCKYLWIVSMTLDAWARTDDAVAVAPSDDMSNGVPVLLPVGLPQGLSVTEGVPVRVVSSTGAATIVTAIPGKPRA